MTASACYCTGKCRETGVCPNQQTYVERWVIPIQPYLPAPAAPNAPIPIQPLPNPNVLLSQPLLTEEDVRRIIREELERLKAETKVEHPGPPNPPDNPDDQPVA